MSVFNLAKGKSGIISDVKVDGAAGERLNALCGQLSEYDTVLVNYLKEIRAGQRSVVDYITVLRNKIQAERDYVTLQTNRQLLIAAYNYWNW